MDIIHLVGIWESEYQRQTEAWRDQDVLTLARDFQAHQLGPHTAVPTQVHRA
jgi:hypothetical protein